MWISKELYSTLRKIVDSAALERTSMMAQSISLGAENAALKAELVRHIADKDWFKLRLNQVEQERAQLIYAATGGHGQVPSARLDGVKIASPQFAEGPPLSETLNHQYNPFGTLGEDSNDPSEQIPGHSADDLTHMPGYKS